MAVHYEDKGKTRLINAISITDDEHEYLELLLFQDGLSRREIYFYDTEVLNVKAVDLIARCRGMINAEVFVQRKHLREYLLRLGIRTTLIQNPYSREQRSRITAIAVGGSADSLSGIFEIARKLLLAPVPIFIVQHIKKDAKNLLSDLLKGRTAYTVVSPVESTSVVPGTIYAAPPGFHMAVKNGVIHLPDEDPVNYAKPSIDVLFSSLAEEYKGGLLAILLCGYGKDGVKALGTVKRNGGKVIIEDPDECKAGELPENALKSDNFPVMSASEMVGYINRNSGAAYEWEAVSQLLKLIYQRYGYDFLRYQKESITRRVSRYLMLRNITILDLEESITGNKENIQELLSGLTLKTTEFFRDSQVYRILRTRLLPYLDSYPSIRIWCAGCSTGEEAYSMAILLKEAGMLEKSLVYATDLSFNNIEQAKNGLYSRDDIKKAEKNYAESGGVERFTDYIDERETYFEIKKQYKDKVLFFQHSLVDSGVLNEFQLILCRNVLMYFVNELQKTTLRLLYESLDISGFLVLGKSEGILANGGNAYFTVIDATNRIYKRNPDKV